ncbi:PREDICTED: cytochrome c oxidase assembly protein COX15 homolog [Nicrophorus vespilloides]|uniref:Cytochrome c oxidase assembly protein COX15 homolog n=1 Tax=Nicrophorus vespilloides TaxID=110193 RepID=A0ABM1N5V9_NICVS|nr:PREDICTED: cytochrome c oxidase assembly protein COX15 homolog [Nicrophorus vespilloides]XP_017782209.1 PREDICTED: cytochrome c oxidase assembly protein COX15 homolog [Nicrophorus vespilloides]XP_017782210.1 PREDICTED: cytochrome c oxidase assembly protein COX15 homolog [Nicrophorus vespilloides]
MLSVGRQCFSKFVLPGSKTLAGNANRIYTSNGLKKMLHSNSLWNKQPLVKHAKGNLLRGTGTVAMRLTAETSTNSNRAVGYWLMTCGGMVFVAVVLGGVTRLTESGLSMVTWKLLGEKMPRTQEEWESEFRKYKEFPEFKIKNKDMTLSEFKWIWHMEFGHRMWGRAIGAAFLVPAAYFWMRGRLRPGMKPRIVAFGSLIAAQGLMGWYMVKSGLEDRFHGESDVPRVSQYRLAAHLSLAFVLYTLFVWSGLDHLVPAGTIPTTSQSVVKAARKFRMLAHSCKGLVFLTAVSGAFVAGLDAGLVYNSFPKMADKWVPDDVMALQPKISNFTENPTTVQFDHRILGTTTLTLISTLWLLSKRRVLPPRAYKAANALAAMAWLQVGLGISTLLTYVPVSLAACHQSGSLVLLSTAIWLTHELKRLPK